MDDGSPDRRLQKRRKIPAGFEFRPRDVELVFYLRRRFHGVWIEEGLFHDVNLYNHHPSKLIELFALRNENKAYLFTPRSRKYPHGSRPCRSAYGGFWKASGKDGPVKNAAGEVVGKKRALSFYEGNQATKGRKTNWLMHEYKIDESHRPPDPASCNGCSTLDDWVLCVVYLRQKTPKDADHEEEDSKYLNTSSNQDEEVGTVFAASSPTNMAVALHVGEATTSGNTLGHDEETGNVIGDPSTSTPRTDIMAADQVYMIDAAETENKRRRGKDIVLYESITSGGSYETNTYTSFMSTMDPQGASADLDPQLITTMEAPLTSLIWPPDLPPEPFQHDHQQGYYNGMPIFDDMAYAYPVVTPLSSIHPQVDIEHAPQTSCCNPSYGQSTEQRRNHRPHQSYYDYPMVTPLTSISSHVGMEQAPHTCSYNPSYAQSLQHLNHQAQTTYDYPVVAPLSSISPQVGGSGLCTYGSALDSDVMPSSFSDDKFWDVQNQQRSDSCIEENPQSQFSIDDFLISDD